MHGKKMRKDVRSTVLSNAKNPYSPGLFDLEIDLSPVDPFLVALDG